ncbi:hypothetical protein A3860_20410 [Niastella vici]|uniref:Outer membrane protein beta-barrel domain-containing protein n=1 Tax=Niastella vici TaxID=1703345 RepID=A0A1V9G194_9BACT|nr:hypothetical protein [Niastella vici]OQP64337.1 hypothetical protein A3860_20410 [Niastella vici]
MKRTITLFTAFLLLTIALHAQKKQPKFLAEIGVGPSFPIGRFASTKYKDDEVPGFAKTGLAAHLSVGYYLRQNVGVLLSYGLSSHPQDKDAYRKDIESQIPGVKLTHMDFTNWQTFKLMGGGFLVTPLTSEGELVLLTKLTAGVSKIVIPKRDFYGSNQDGTSTVSSMDTGRSLPWSFCYQVSLGLEYKLNRNLYVLLDISSFNTTGKMEWTYTAIPGGDITIKNKYKQGTVNTLAGIGLHF